MEKLDSPPKPVRLCSVWTERDEEEPSAFKIPRPEM
jgi:hypothetical protein